YLVNVSTSPAEAAEIQCEVNGSLGGNYSYRAVATTDGKACLWLPEGEQMLSAAGYHASSLTVAASDASNAVTLSKPDAVMAHDSNELRTYLAAANVTTIDLVTGTTYTLDGTTVKRDLTINGNGAIINVGAGFDDTIIKREDNTVNGRVFLAVQSGSLTVKNVTLRDVSTRILAAINVKMDGTLLLDGVTFEGFFANLSTDAYPDSSANIPGSYNNFGVHAEPGAVSTTVKNCTFGSSNTFRNAVAIRKGTAVIKDNVFVGTAMPDRQNQTDGFEYAVYLYGGTCTVIGNDISGYDSILKPLGYHSAGISTCPYYSLTATITGNKLYDNARGIDGVGAWHTYSDPTDVNINGIVLKDSEDAFAIGQALKSDNTFTGNMDGNIAIILDQNDNYIDTLTGIEYGPPAYFEPLLKLDSTNSTGATLSFDTGTWARAMVSNAKNILIQVSEDNGVTWGAASTTGTINAASPTGTVNLAAGKTYLLRSVMTITANTRPFGSEDNVSADITCYSNTVSPTISSSGGKGHSGDSGTVDSEGAAVIVNGESKTAGTAQTTTGTDGRTTTTVIVDSGKLESILSSTEQGATVMIPVAGNPDTAAGILTGEMVKGMENREATLVIKTDSATYTLPAAEINITAISEQLGTKIALKDIKVEVSISAPSSQMSKAVESAAKNGGFTPVLAAVDYTVTCSHGGRTVNVGSFNAYVERTVAIPDGVDPSKITTGIVVKPDGTTHHVPTRVTVINGKYYAVINSLTNSTYSVIWNPIVFADMNNHWGKASVNNMGSRLVVDGVGDGSFEPDRDMTRAEFAAVMIRALGLEPDSGKGSFSDIPSAKWYRGYVQTAAAYGIIKGYSDVVFGPDDKITREQAMTMIARAMKITGLSAGLTSVERDGFMGAYKDRSAVSSFAGDSVAECIKTGVVSGRGSNLLAPKAYVTRAEVAAMIERLLQKSNLI
ncbi:MAG: putative surface layer protein, partial [Caproiciproducens sp.]|nr:putative surface layer protein [Caproiciproducens sp.]